MRLKKFSGATLKEATEQMKAELGDNAIILNTRKVSKNGVLSFLGKEEFVVVGAIDEQAMSSAAIDRKFAGRLAEAAGDRSTDASGTLASLQRVAEQFQQRQKERTGTPVETPMNSVAGYHALKSDVEGLRSVVDEIATYLKYGNMPPLPDVLKEAYTRLIDQDVNKQLAADLVLGVYRKLGEEGASKKAEAFRCLLNDIASLFKPMFPNPVGRKPRVIALVGPTGVGKTTTIAKLAAIHKLVQKQSVGLISADTYRIGAIEQLRTFASIADIPMEIAYKPHEMNAAAARFKDKDIVLIDTVGRSQKMKDDLAELGQFVGEAQPDQVHLVLSMSAGSRVIDETISSFKSIGPNCIIFSKVDEAATFGQMANVGHTYGLPVSYITTGQNVPEDIKLASYMQLAEMVYTGELANA